jgi:ceramide glucosyltransferase
MSEYWVLGIWTSLGLAWWILSLLLVAFSKSRRPCTQPPDTRRITIFKPLAPLVAEEFERLRACLESFAAVLDDNSELVIGCHQRDESRLQPFVKGMRGRYPDAEIKLVVHSDPNGYPNPKVAWMHILATRATGELWLWSDADMEAPPGAIRSLRTEFANAGASLLTFPYIVRSARKPAELLDALFVNLEFYPGAVLLGRLDLIRFGFGSGMLFEAERFRSRVDWDFLGGCLAEDFHLGRILEPARLGSTRFVTSPVTENWRGAILHYLRWQKTIRWCRPGSYAAQLIVLPVVGWLTWLILNPTSMVAWLGLLGIVALDSIAALAICRVLGCRIGLRRFYAVPLWSLTRGLSWVACWLPWPIVWRGRKWWSPLQRTAARAKVLEPESQVGVD